MRTRAIRRLVALGILGAVVPVALSASGASTAPPAPASAVVPVAPYRILDTRDGTGTAGVTAAVKQNSTITVQIAGVGPVPTGATGVVVNLTGTGATGATFITAFPTGTPRSMTSVLNVTPGSDIANTITVPLGTGGALDLYNNAGSVHLVADVTGYLIDVTSLIPAPSTTLPAKDHTLVIGAYEGRMASGVFQFFHYGCLRTTNGGDVWYDVPLPNGAVVTSVDVHYYDGTSPAALTMQLWYSSWNDPGAPTNVGQPSALPDSGARFITTTIQEPAMAPLASPNRYYLEASIGASAQLLFCGADIHYTLSP